MIHAIKAFVATLLGGVAVIWLVCWAAMPGPSSPLRLRAKSTAGVQREAVDREAKRSLRRHWEAACEAVRLKLHHPGSAEFPGGFYAGLLPKYDETLRDDDRSGL
jgi:hypothetical protein